MIQIIVGVDWGTNVGVAVFNLKKRLILLESFKNISEDEFISIIKDYRPILICSDVNDPPEAVYRISSRLGAKLFTPSKDLSVEEKIELTRNYKYKNVHERDALAAALYFFKVKGKLIEKIKEDFFKDYFDRIIEDVFRKVILEEVSNIEEAFKDLFKRKEVVKEVFIIKKSGKEGKLEKKIAELKERIKRQRKIIENLKEKAKETKVIKEKVYVYKDKELKEKVKRYEELVEDLKNKIKILEEEIEKFMKYKDGKVEIEKLSEILKIWKYVPKGSKIIVREIDKVNKEIIKKLKEINPKEIVYDTANNDALEKLEDHDFNIRKRKLTKEDILRIFSS